VDDTTRRQFLKQAMAAGASLAVAQLMWDAAAPIAGAQTTGNIMSKVPNPLDEPIDVSKLGSLNGPLLRIRDAYGWAAESFAGDRYQAADHPAWQKRMREEVFAALQVGEGKTRPPG
jgi:hypothetical protein